MIKRFHVLYVGQVELENIGLAGTPADARRYGNDRLIEPFFTARDVAQLMDDLGYHAVQDPCTTYDLWATVLHLLGLDHERLTYRFGGRDFRLTDVHGQLLRSILA